MGIEYNIDSMATTMALMVLRQIRDRNADANIAAFSGDVEKQFRQLLKLFHEVILSSGLFSLGEISSPQKDQWMAALERLEKKLLPFEQHLGDGGSRGTPH